jgi:hypothetical protein
LALFWMYTSSMFYTILFWFVRVIYTHLTKEKLESTSKCKDQKRNHHPLLHSLQPAAFVLGTFLWYLGGVFQALTWQLATHPSVPGSLTSQASLLWEKLLNRPSPPHSTLCHENWSQLLGVSGNWWGELPGRKAAGRSGPLHLDRSRGT